MLDRFIEHKAKQLTFYTSHFLRGILPHSELHMFVWDTLEEWTQFKFSTHTPQSDREQVFWHLINELEFWPETSLQHNQNLRRNIEQCLYYLNGYGKCPHGCVGIRP